MTTFIETERLRIDFPTLADYDELLQLQTDTDVMRYIGDGSISTPEKVKAKLEKDITHFRKHQFGTGVVFEKFTGAFVGLGGLTFLEYNDTQPDVELDALLHKAYWGKGYGVEIVNAAIDRAFKQLCVARVTAVIDLNNTRSQHLCRKCGLIYREDVWCYNKTMQFYDIAPSQTTGITSTLTTNA